VAASPDEPKTFRPSIAAYRDYLNFWDRRQGRLIVWIVPLTIAGNFVISIFLNRSNLVWSFVLTGLFLVAGLYLLLFFRVSRVTASAGRLEVRNALGIVRVVTAAQLSRVVRISDYRIPLSPYTLGSAALGQERLLVLDSNGRKAMSWLSSSWSDHQMKQLTTSLAIGEDDITSPMDAAALRRRYPHSVPWWIAHTFLTAMIIAGIIVVLAGAAIAIDIAITGG
jgi:hypothetical protein